MKRFSRVSLAAVLALGASTLAFGQASAPGPWEKFKSYAVEQKAEAVAEGKRAIAEVDKKIAALGQDMKTANAETKAAHAQNMKELKARKKAAQAELRKLEKSAGNAWDAGKEGFSNAWKDLSAAYDKAAADVKK